MAVPQVVIVGRPNVGKSSLFNYLARRRLAIVDPTAGVTRDRISQMLCEEDRYFELVDTGGIGIVDSDDLAEHVEQQIAMAIESADVILFVVDVREGVLPLDEEVARRLRPIDKPIILAANKADHEKLVLQSDEFRKLASGPLVCTSTLQNRGRDELVDLIVERLPPREENDEPAEPAMKVAIVGRRNVGKSTFVNTLAQSERMIVSEVPGTTRDSVDVRFEIDGKTIIAIDTPGLKRSKSVKTDLDFYSTHRAERSVRRADVVLMFFDAAEPISRMDKQLCGYIVENHKPCIFVVNKWDLYAGKVITQEWADHLHAELPMLQYAPIIFITGQTGKNVKTLVNHAQMLFAQSRRRVGTSQLNQLVRAAIQRNPPPVHRNRRPKIYYATQVDVQPPTIVLFCNEPTAFGKTYRRFLLNMLSDQLDFGEVPIKLYFRRRTESDKPIDLDDAPIEDHSSP